MALSLKQKLMAGFAAAAVLAAPVAATHNTAYADGAGVERTNVAVEEQQVFSRKEAYRASTSQIVLHYGAGMKRVQNIEDVLNGMGYPTAAYAGGPDGQIQLFVGRGIFGLYDQDDLDDGSLGDDAIVIFQERIGPAASLSGPAVAASLE